MNKLRLLITVIFLTTMGFMWMSLKDKATPVTGAMVDNNRQPDYVAHDLTRTVFDHTGRKTQSLSAKKMTYFEKENRAAFESPLLILESAQNNGKWRISATSGVLFQNERLLLEQDVNAINLNASEYIDRITGENIRVNITDSMMLSDHDVNLFGDGLHITGSSLIADLNDQKIELLKHARTIYQNNTKQP